MFRIPTSLLSHGVSVVTTDTPNTTLKLKTLEGVNLFQKRCKLLDYAKKNGNEETYMNYMRQEFNDVRQEMSNFINDQDTARKYKMDESDPYGWAIYYELLDRWVVADWFANKIPLVKGA